MLSKSSFTFTYLTAALACSLTACVTDAPDDHAHAHAADVRSSLTATGTLAPAVTADGAVAFGPSAALETIAASCGDLALDVTLLGSRPSATGVTTTVRAGLVEIVEQRADGLEQSWRFERAPSSVGDLTIVVGTTGFEEAGTTDTGLLFRRTGEFDVHYGHGTWIDAGGTRWPVPARHDHGRILLTVPASVVTRSAYPAVLDPQIIVTPG